MVTLVQLPLSIGPVSTELRLSVIRARVSTTRKSAIVRMVKYSVIGTHARWRVLRLNQTTAMHVPHNLSTATDVITTNSVAGLKPMEHA
jgi:hypothetical protein